jgi:mono/diheme cytochrome c family protein
MCHGEDGQGGAAGPNLSRMTDASIVVKIVSGGRDQMPAFGSRLSAGEIRDVSAYVATLSAH